MLCNNPMHHTTELLPDASSEQHSQSLFGIPHLRATLHCKDLRQLKLFGQFAHSSEIRLTLRLTIQPESTKCVRGSWTLAPWQSRVKDQGPSASNFHSSRKTASRRSEYDHDGPSGGSGVSTSGQSRCATSLLSLAWRMAEGP